MIAPLETQVRDEMVRLFSLRGKWAIPFFAKVFTQTNIHIEIGEQHWMFLQHQTQDCHISMISVKVKYPHYVHCYKAASISLLYKRPK